VCWASWRSDGASHDLGTSARADRTVLRHKPHR
jgi:hypothetical protein